MDGARALLHGEAECLARGRWDLNAAHDLLGKLGDRAHHLDDVDDLKVALLALADRLLASDHEHGHAAELGVGGASDEIGRAGAERGEDDAGLAGQAADCGGHEGAGLLMAHEDQLDLGIAERLDEIKILLAGHTKHPLDTLLHK